MVDLLILLRQIRLTSNTFPMFGVGNTPASEWLRGLPTEFDRATAMTASGLKKDKLLHELNQLIKMNQLVQLKRTSMGSAGRPKVIYRKLCSRN